MSLNVDIYLRNAFRELDAFSLPEVGTFRKVHLSAEVDEYHREVYPPRIEIEFSPQVDTQVSLERYLIHQIQMPVSDASRIIVDIGQEIKSSLASEGQFLLTGIGKLVRKPSGISFLQAGDKWVSGEFFGLQPVKLTFAVSDSQAANAEEEKTPMAGTIPHTAPQQSPRRNWRVASAVIAAATVGIIAFFLRGQFALERTSGTAEWRTFTAQKLEPSTIPAESTPPSSYLADTETDPDNQVPAAESGSDVPESNTDELLALNEPANDPAGNEGAPAPDARTRDVGGVGLPRGQEDGSSTGNLDQLSSPNARIAKPGVTYYVILGSFRQERSVSKFVTKLQKDGLTPKVLKYQNNEGKDAFRVSIFESQNRTEAEVFSQKMERLGYGKPWVFEAADSN